MLRDVLKVIYQSNLVVDSCKRVRGDSVFQECNVDVQEGERKNRIGDWNVGDKILNDAGAARDKGYKGEIECFFSVCRIFLRNGVVYAESHCRYNVCEIQTDEERQ